jgi:hypothetical protein
MERVDPTSELGKILVWSSGQKATDLFQDMRGFAPSFGAILKPDAAR